MLLSIRTPGGKTLSCRASPHKELNYDKSSVRTQVRLMTKRQAPLQRIESVSWYTWDSLVLPCILPSLRSWTKCKLGVGDGEGNRHYCTLQAWSARKQLLNCGRYTLSILLSYFSVQTPWWCQFHLLTEHNLCPAALTIIAKRIRQAPDPGTT